MKSLRSFRFYWLPDVLLFHALVTVRLPINPDLVIPEIEAPAAVWVGFTVLFAISAIFRPSLRLGSRWAGLLTAFAYLGALAAYGRPLDFTPSIAYMIVQIFLPRIPMSLRRDAMVDVPERVTVMSRISTITERALTPNDIWRQSMYTKEKFERNWWLRLPRLTYPGVTLVFVGLNILLYWLAWRQIPPESYWNVNITLVEFPLAMMRSSLQSPQEWWRLFSSMFFHWDVLHLISNMLFLFWLGRILEPVLGGVRFAVYYLLGGGLASIAGGISLLEYQLSAGASGAIFTLIGVYVAFLLIHYRVLDTDGKERWVVLAMFVLYTMFNTLLSSAYSPVNHAAHIGGFVVGVGLMLVCGPNYDAAADPADSTRMIVVRRLWWWRVFARKHRKQERVVA